MEGALGAVGEGLFEIGLDEGSSGELRRGYGGDVANVCVMAARAGAPARLVGRVGDDALGRALLTFWHGEGVGIEDVRIDSGAPTGIYVNERTRAGGHRFDYHRRGSAGSRLTAGDLTARFFEDLGVLHASGISVTVCGSATGLAVERARRDGAVISFAVNHRRGLGADHEAVLTAARAADIVFVSAEEAEDLLHTSAVEDVRAALRWQPREVVVTAGAEGAAVVTGGDVVTVRAPALEAVDAAGAGDALAGAYLAARLGGFDAETALRRGVAAAALSCGSFGCALSYPTAAEVDALVPELV